MLPQHVFSHQHQYPHTDPSWQLQQQQNHHQHQPHHGTQHNVQAQAAAAAAAAQQQHYNRIANNNSAGAQSMGGDHNSGFNAPDQGMSAEERRILEWIVQLMNPNSRESALLELSKKREQFPQLALILWHSFGTLLFTPIAIFGLKSNSRRHDISAPRNYLRLPTPQPFPTHSRRIKPGLQCPCPPPMCRFSQRDPFIIP